MSALRTGRHDTNVQPPRPFASRCVCNRSVMAGRARLSSARRADIDGVRRRAEDRRALPPAVIEALRRKAQTEVSIAGWYAADHFSHDWLPWVSLILR